MMSMSLRVLLCLVVMFSSAGMTVYGWDELENCVTSAFSCNESRKNPDPPACGGAFTRCEDNTVANCPDLPSCVTGLKGDYPERPATDCVACSEAERGLITSDDEPPIVTSGPCNCVHCKNDEQPAVCRELWACFKRTSEVLEPVCEKSIHKCSTTHVTAKIDTDCEGDES